MSRWNQRVFLAAAGAAGSVSALDARAAPPGQHHHCKCKGFRPGDVHLHFFGTALLSFTDGVKTETGDIFEIEAAPFRLPVRNPIAGPAAEDLVDVGVL